MFIWSTRLFSTKEYIVVWYILITKHFQLPDGPERRKLIYQATTEEKALKRKKTDYCIMEQELHESYQLLLKVNFGYINFCQNKKIFATHFSIVGKSKAFYHK